MLDTLTSITNLINSPPGQLVAGGVLAGIVWTFFERVEVLLTEQTKFEIAVWLVGVKLGQKVEPWPKTFGLLINKVFGARHPTWTGISRSFVATFSTQLLLVILIAISPSDEVTKVFGNLSQGLGFVGGLGMFLLVIVLQAGLFTVPDYITIIFLQRAIGHILKKGKSLQRRAIAISVLFPVLYVSLLILGIDTLLWSEYRIIRVEQRLFATLPAERVPEIFRGSEIVTGSSEANMKLLPFIGMRLKTATLQDWLENLGMGFPLYLSSVWLWLYASSGFLLRVARRFDIGFQWFNRRFDIEKKPLQSIGLVAGALVAVVYWAAVMVAHLV